ncbi:tail fiber domain-containing protein [Aneurinibacillus sp. Ricciae_BoGa-3]|uniref:tail fiber domain-containing protein n=1 Tax=Aneurinibacillus sp. Ricciae_BoGa-3 TaxID=3022697 RepID=UPI0023417FA7|nr:tail fiber domain-containing protein [Aneurinibacillus sp. Ricciae_BoGa-3]WCK55440.1 tail fiber domain-containing protein [Aneurinibacillus sp. Ricciae_BoGa-3]
MPDLTPNIGLKMPLDTETADISIVNENMDIIDTKLHDAQQQAAGAIPATGGAMTGPLTLSADPTEAMHAVTKQYADQKLSNAAGAVGDTNIGNRTADPSQAPSGLTGTLTNWFSWITNRIKAITGKANWYDNPRTTLDNAVKLNGDTMTGNLGLGIDPTCGLHQLGGAAKIQALADPAAPTVTATGTTATTSYSYYIVARDRNGRTTKVSPVTTITNGNATLSANNYNAISWPAIAGAATYDVLKGNTSTALATGLTATSVNDTGQATSSYTAPTRNTTADVLVDGAVVLGGVNNINNPTSPVLLAPSNANGLGMDQFGNLLPINPGALTAGANWSVLDKNGNLPLKVKVDGTKSVIAAGGIGWNGGDPQNGNSANAPALITDQGGSIELGSQGSSAVTPYIDFHTGVGGNDYDVRIQAAGGTAGTVGKGSLTLRAGAVFTDHNTLEDGNGNMTIVGYDNKIAVGTSNAPTQDGHLRFASNGIGGGDGAWIEYVQPSAAHTNTNTAKQLNIAGAGGGNLDMFKVYALTSHFIGSVQTEKYMYGYGQVGTVTPGEGQGWYLGWNQQSGSGAMELMNNGGTGNGGFNFWNAVGGGGGTFSKVAYITSTGQGYFNGTYSTSDERLKTDIVPIDNALEKVTQIRGVNYRWNEKYLETYPERDTPQVGVIAQEVEKVLPEAVTVMDNMDINDGEEYKSVDYARLVPLLIQAFKELNDKVEELTKKVGE